MLAPDFLLPVYHLVSDPSEGECYTSFVNSSTLCLACIFLCWIASELTHNYSQVDKMWSLVPWMYMWVYMFTMETLSQRVLLMTFVATVWGIRLTLNFARRGGYSWPPWAGEEDYRWVHVQDVLFKAKEHPILWKVFNLLFIAIYQHVLLMMLAMPVHVACVHRATPLDLTDMALAVAVLVLVALEGLADHQQIVFQTEKYRRINAKEERDGEYADGFLSSGLFAVSRHPAYTCEQLIWIMISVFGLKLNNSSVISVVGSLALVMLFQVATRFSEYLTANKYPRYAEYQATTFMFLPFGTSYKTKQE